MVYIYTFKYIDIYIYIYTVTFALIVTRRACGEKPFHGLCDT